MLYAFLHNNNNFSIFPSFEIVSCVQFSIKMLYNNIFGHSLLVDIYTLHFFIVINNTECCNKKGCRLLDIHFNKSSAK